MRKIRHKKRMVVRIVYTGVDIWSECWEGKIMAVAVKVGKENTRVFQVYGTLASKLWNYGLFEGEDQKW